MSPVAPVRVRSEARKLYDTLLKVDFLNQLKVEEMDELLAAMRKRKYAPGETVFKQGAPGDALYLVASGSLEVRARKVLVKRKVGILGPGQYFGEGSLLDDAPHSATVVAETLCELYILHKQDFDHILLRNPGISAALRAHKVLIKDRRRRA